MINKKAEIKKIWKECFNDTPEFVEMYFNRVYTDNAGMVLEDESGVVSSLLLHSYPFLYQNTEIPISYIAGAATRRQARGKGYMSRLIVDALKQSRERGDALCTLIPAHDWLYFFYDRFGFQTIFYTDTQRFTSLHAFAGSGSYHEIDNHFNSEVYEAMHRFEMERGCGILHTQRDFLNIMDDVNIDNESRFVALADETGIVASMAWATAAHGIVEVRELLGRDNEARTAALRALRKYYPNMPFRVLAPAESGNRHLYARGMARIVNVEKLLTAVAQSHPNLRLTIRVKDNLLKDNSHTYIIRGGKVMINDTATLHLDLDVTVEVLCSIAFSDKQMGEIIGLPSERAHMSLMLD